MPPLSYPKSRSTTTASRIPPPHLYTLGFSKGENPSSFCPPKPGGAGRKTMNNVAQWRGPWYRMSCPAWYCNNCCMTLDNVVTNPPTITECLLQTWRSADTELCLFLRNSQLLKEGHCPVHTIPTAGSESHCMKVEMCLLNLLAGDCGDPSSPLSQFPHLSKMRAGREDASKDSPNTTLHLPFPWSFQIHQDSLVHHWDWNTWQCWLYLLRMHWKLGPGTSCIPRHKSNLTPCQWILQTLVALGKWGKEVA